MALSDLWPAPAASPNDRPVAVAVEAKVGARESWSARTGFIAAAIGSAVGLGNVWRFPNLCYTYGGGAFFVPYLLAMALIGIPLLTLELALGQVFRSGDLTAFGAMHKRLRGVGLGSVWCGFMVVCYYAVIIAWAITMLINSFRGSDDFPWSEDASTFFRSKVIGVAPATLPDGSINRSMKLVPQTWVGLTIVWLCIYFCTFKGPKMVGRISYVTMSVPFVLLIVLALYFAGLTNAHRGLELYVGQWDMKQLSGGMCGTRSCDEAWPDAVSQVFFSLGVTFGVMTAYASYNPINQGVQVDAIVTAFGDLATSFIAGFLVFASVGVYASATGQDVAVAAQGSGGFGLAFVSMPAAFTAIGQAPYNLPLGFRKLLAILFYLTLILLGIDSAFSLCEGFSTCMKDCRLFKDVPREALIGVICLVGYCVSLGYCTDIGLYALATNDYYINITMLFVGYMECLSAGWVAFAQEQAALIGWPAWCTAFGSMLFASVLAPVIGLGLGAQSAHAEPGTAVGLLFGFVLFGLGLAMACRLAMRFSNRPMSMGVLYDVLLSNIELLRADINSVCGRGAGNVGIPLFWSFMIKFFVPAVLMFMLVLKFMSPVFGAYGDYHQWFQGWGIAVAFVPFMIQLIGLYSPSVYEDLMPEKEYTLHELLGRHSSAQVAVDEDGTAEL